ncbi:hypothetical protein AB4254_12255 [Vibrio breoganii]
MRLLSKEKAVELIEYFEGTNYELAIEGEEVFTSAEDARIYVESDYDETKESISLVYPVEGSAENWELDSISVFHDEKVGWTFEDMGMGGVRISGDTLDVLVPELALVYEGHYVVVPLAKKDDT